MKAQKISLQKFTKSELKINNILANEQITPEDLLPLTSFEREKFNEIITDKLNTCKGAEKDNLLKKIDP